MIELLIAAGAAGVGYVKSRGFVAQRLRYVDAIRNPIAPIIAGGAAFAIATPIVAVLPIVGGATALAFGAAIGIGTRAGVRRIQTTSAAY